MYTGIGICTCVYVCLGIYKEYVYIHILLYVCVYIYVRVCMLGLQYTRIYIRIIVFYVRIICDYNVFCVRRTLSAMIRIKLFNQFVAIY